MTPRSAVLAAVVSAALAPALAAQDAPGSGKAAFDRRDFATAAALWRAEAAAGSAEASFGLGLLSDLGLGTARDAAKALRWYMEAASDGMPEAEFNVGVMMDAGTGVPRDPVAAAVWYARAAANDHNRGQYNLGLLYESGDGVPRNADLARYWFDRAGATLPAASERRAALVPTTEGERRFVAPDLGAAVPVPAETPRMAELVWSAPPGPQDSRYLVELAQLPEGGETWGSLLLSQSTGGSALATPLPARTARYAWRVSLVNARATHYAASNWQILGAEAAPGRVRGIPEGRVILHVGGSDGSARWLAEEVAGSFWNSGLWVRIEEDRSPAAETGVRYAFAEDATLAASVAEFLPVLSEGDTLLAPDPDAAPGEVHVWLAGGPSAPETPLATRVSVTETAKPKSR